MSDASEVVSTHPATSRIRVIYRAGDGTIHQDWPFDQVASAIADPDGTTWIDINDDDLDLGDVETVFHEVFHFHPLAIEDALQDTNVPKIDDWGDYLTVVFHAIEFDSSTLKLIPQELDIFLGRNYLVTYHSVMLPVLRRLRLLIEREGAKLDLGADHLLYHLLDLGVADFLPVIERLDDAIDAAQDEVFNDPDPGTLQDIFRIKRAALRLHRTLIPLREVLNRLARDEHAQIDALDRVYFRDVYDQLVRLHDISETLRDLISGALDTYLSAISNRTNDVMKTLTVVTVLFLPLNFVVGFFGMNFFDDNISLSVGHRLHLVLFLAIIACMVLSPLAMWAWAKRRRWF